MDRRRADPAGEELGGELLDECAADLAADLLAPVGDRQRRLEDRLGACQVVRRRRSPPVRTSVGNIVRQPSGSAVSPFITARASRRWTGVASASRSPRGRPAGPPGCRRRRRPGRRARRPGTSRPLPDRERGRPAGRSTASRWRGADPRSGRSRRWRGRSPRWLRPRRRPSPCWAATASKRVRHASVRSLTYDHSSSISSPSSVEHGVGVEGAVDEVVDRLVGHRTSLPRGGTAPSDGRGRRTLARGQAATDGRRAIRGGRAGLEVGRVAAEERQQLTPRALVPGSRVDADRLGADVVGRAVAGRSLRSRRPGRGRLDRARASSSAAEFGSIVHQR